jgi:16S rRNA (guanine966-N2)-methyltransferase
MTRIIAGSAGGRRIKTPAGSVTRPTSDRVREALFSALESEIGPLSGLRFLDLYAGSGAIGLEARSRGAGYVTLVEQDRRTSGLIRQNADSLGFGECEVLALSVTRVLAAPPRAPYDVIFADPPYAVTDDEVAGNLELLVDNGWLAHEALVIVERPARRSEVRWPLNVAEVRMKKYGETALWYGRAANSSPGRA